MKRFSLLFLSLLIISCATEQVPVEEYASAAINVAIQNTTDSILTVSSRDFKEELTLVDGSISGEITIPEDGLYYLRNNKKYVQIYLERGKTADITYDMEDVEESFSSTGELASENMYIQAKSASDKEGRIPNKEKYSSSEEDFIKIVDETKERQSTLLASFKSGDQSLSENFLKMEKTNIHYQWANAMANYEGAHKYYTKDEEFKASEKITSYLSKVDLNDAKALNSSQFKSFIGSYLYESANKFIEENEEYKGKDVYTQQYNMISELIENEEVRDHAYFSTISNILDFSSVDKAASLIEHFNSNCKNEEFKTKFQEKFDEWKDLVKGKSAPVFAYPDIEGTLVSLEEFKGKNVYIDVWATWCGPCKVEQPFLEELQEEYKDNSNIIFASVSIDENKDAWEKMVQEKELKGVHLIADNAWESDIVTDYMIKGIPRFMLIGPDGNILDVNAPRPSSDELKTVLAALANKT